MQQRCDPPPASHKETLPNFLLECTNTLEGWSVRVFALLCLNAFLCCLQTVLLCPCLWWDGMFHYLSGSLLLSLFFNVNKMVPLSLTFKYRSWNITLRNLLTNCFLIYMTNYSVMLKCVKYACNLFFFFKLTLWAITV